MLSVYAIAPLIVGASVLLGRALLLLFGRGQPNGLAGAVGFAALTIAAPILIRLPGRAATAAVLLGLVLLAALFFLWRSATTAGRNNGQVEKAGTGASGSGPLGRGRRRMRRRQRGRGTGPDGAGAGAVPLVTTLVVLAVAALPFLFNDRIGVLGEGIYTNDQAAQLYWTDWLQNDNGPEPSAVRFGYPTGPQSVTAVAAEATGIDLDDAFNGLLLAIPVLTALAALAALGELPPLRRVAAASLAGLPYLAASFLAQSAFKETVMALLVLAFTVALGELGREGPRRATLATLVVLAGAALFTYNVPGLAWFGIGVPIWLAFELATGWRPVDLHELRGALRRHRTAIAFSGVVVVGVAVLSAGQVSSFFDRLGLVQDSAGRLSSPVFPGEALGLWPEGNFQLVRGEVTGAIPAALLGLLAATLGGLAALRRRDYALAGMLVAAVIIYSGARQWASIYVEAKALSVMAPLVMLGGLRFLLAPGNRLKVALGVVVAACAAGSTFLALRSAPVGFDQRGEQLEALAKRIGDHRVVFLGVDRFSAYWLRGTQIVSPGGYVPAEIHPRPEKVWQQGDPMDLDTLAPNRLDDFNFAITTTAAYQSAPPAGMEAVRATASFVLWRRVGEIPPTHVLNEGGAPGRLLDCSTGRGRGVSSHAGAATVRPTPVVGSPEDWSLSSPFDAPDEATQELRLPPGVWDLSLQYNSQSELTVSAGGREVRLPPSLDGMYLTHQGQASFWPAGQVRVRGRGPTTVTVAAAAPNGLQDALGVERQTWLGRIAATAAGGPIDSIHPLGARQVPLRFACDAYVDHYVVEGGGRKSSR